MANENYDMEITRVFDAPLDLVWKAWTDPKQLAQWWGPDGFTNKVKKFEPNPKGALSIDMIGPDDVAYPMEATFSEIVPMTRIVFKGGPVDKNGKPIMHLLNTAIFEEQKGKTKLTLKTHVTDIFDPVGKKYLSGQGVGWSQSIGRLAEYLSTGKVEKKQPHW